MTTKIGVPRTMFYYRYYPMVKTFFEELGVEVVTSQKTSRQIIDAGVREALADACVPVKIFFGHVQALKNKVDLLFIPRVYCLNGKTIYCPKFLGAPDMIKYALDGLPEIIDTSIDVRKKRFAIWKAFKEIGSRFTDNKWAILKAYLKAKHVLSRYNKYLLKGFPPELAMKKLKNPKLELKPQPKSLRFAVLGYPYIVHDGYISVNLLDKLHRLDVDTITIEQIPKHLINRQRKKLHKNMFWTFSDWVMRSSLHFFDKGNIDGIIHVTAFGCGPDAMVDKFMELESKKNPHIPYMSICIDEHTGEAGVGTRLEAFVDMVKRKKEAKRNA